MPRQAHDTVHKFSRCFLYTICVQIVSLTGTTDKIRFVICGCKFKMPTAFALNESVMEFVQDIANLAFFFVVLTNPMNSHLVKPSQRSKLIILAYPVIVLETFHLPQQTHH